ncbi:MAG: inositol monophosphatase [Gammaproteobacteria bacterium]|nr:inositol monophosphatase [Gammaproteobacteria bacterium]|tara:strand:+ start:1916 stop:2704 length:789 start_codon:yes stop_codon:yes gene_type:complete
MIQETLNNATFIAKEAGSILLEGYGNPGTISHKGISDIVTHYDKKSEDLIIEFIKNKYPDHSITAEESGILNGTKDNRYHWLIDPLDGTTNFAHSFPFFAVSICLLDQNKPLLGVVYDPLRDELFSSISGKPSTLNNRPIKVSKTKSLQDSLIGTGFPYDMNTNLSNNLKEFGSIMYESQGVRRAGAAALDLCYTACGRLDGFWEFELQPWDMAAGALIVTNSGGQVTNTNGDPNWFPGISILASNGLIHQEILANIKNKNS